MASGVLTGTDQFTLHQGVEMGRPSEITLTVLSDGETIERILVRGSAVPIARGTIRVP